MAQYRAGKNQTFGFLVGQVMKGSKGKANPKIANELLKRELDKIDVGLGPPVPGVRRRGFRIRTPDAGLGFPSAQRLWRGRLKPAILTAHQHNLRLTLGAQAA